MVTRAMSQRCSGRDHVQLADGLQGNLQRMLDRTPAARVHRSMAVRALKHQGSGWFVETATGHHGPYRSVVLNAPPHVGRTLLPAAPNFARRTVLLRAYGYFDSRILIHTDPTYVQRDRQSWAVYNGWITGRQCEGSVWYGALHQKLPSGATIDVFKSSPSAVTPTRSTSCCNGGSNTH